MESIFVTLLVCFFIISALIVLHNDWSNFKESFDRKQEKLDNTWQLLKFKK